MRTKTLFGMFGLLLGAPLLADAQPLEPLEQQRRERAQQLFFEAEDSYSAGNYTEALAGYDQAYLLTQEPLLLFNQAQCFRQLQRYQEALDTYQRFLDELPDERTYAPKAKEWIAAIEAETGLRPTPATQPAADVALTTPTSALATRVKPDSEEAHLSQKLFWVGVGTGSLWAGFGVASLSISLGAAKLQQQPSDAESAAALAATLEQRQQRAALLGTLSDLALISTVAVVTGALALHVKEKKASVAVLPAGALLTVRF